MPKTTFLIKLLAASLSLGSLVACSGGGSSAPVSVNAAGKHPSDWLQQHFVAYKAANGGSKAVSATTGCSECHGSDLSGGISKVSCFSASFNGMSCHANADGTLGHPAAWVDQTSSDFHALASFNGRQVKGSSDLAASCGICHPADSSAPAASGIPSCLSTDPKWGISCHAASPVAASSGCASCHGTGLGHEAPAGSTAPNRAGAHAAHTDLGIGCSACHSGTSSGTAKHATAALQNGGQAYIKLGAVYGAQTVAFSYDQTTCSGVSCHGGKTTPAWTGHLAVTNCRSCHSDKAQKDEKNSYTSNFSSSGFTTAGFDQTLQGLNLHQFHLAVPNPLKSGLIDCVDCHNVSLLTAARHFGGVDTPAMLDPFATIGNQGSLTGPTSVSVYVLDQATGTYNCTNQCHTQAPNPSHWQ